MVDLEPGDPDREAEVEVGSTRPEFARGARERHRGEEQRSGVQGDRRSWSGR